MKEKKKLVLFGIGGLLVLFLVIGVSYAVWQLVLQQTNENVVTTDCFKINFTEKNDIQLNNAYPIIDQEGKKLTPYEFTIENTCDNQASYQVNLEILDSTTLMKHEYIKVMFDEYAPRILTSYNETKKTLDNATTSYKLGLGFLEGNTSKTFTLRLWMDEATPPVDDAMNKIFKSKVTVVTSYKEPADTTNMIAERYTLPEGKKWDDVLNDKTGELVDIVYASDKYTFMQDSHKIILQNTMSLIEGIIPIDMSINQDNSVLAYKDESNENEIITYIQANGNIVLPKYSVSLFMGLESLISIDGMRYLDTSNVTNMSSMFYNCSSLTSLDLSSFNTETVTDMSYMFSNCSSLTNLVLSSFNTETVTDMSSMFSGCHSLTSLDVRNFDTTNVMNMSFMFRFCVSLTYLNLRFFNTENVIDMNYMFWKCINLIEVTYGDNFIYKDASTIINMYGSCPANKPTHSSWEGVTFS